MLFSFHTSSICAIKKILLALETENFGNYPKNLLTITICSLCHNFLKTV